MYETIHTNALLFLKASHMTSHFVFLDNIFNLEDTFNIIIITLTNFLCKREQTLAICFIFRCLKSFFKKCVNCKNAFT